MKKTRYLLVLILFGCNPESEKVSIEVDTACVEPRPEVCTKEYKPVCGYIKDGSTIKTFSNGCEACSDKEVFGYITNEC